MRRPAPVARRRAGPRRPAPGAAGRRTGHRRDRRRARVAARRAVRTGVASRPGRPSGTARDRRPGRVLGGSDLPRDPAGAGRAAHLRRGAVRGEPRPARRVRGGPARHRPAARPVAVGRRGQRPAGGPGSVRRLRLPGEDAARHHGRAHRRPGVRGGLRRPVLRPPPAPGRLLVRGPAADRGAGRSCSGRHPRRQRARLRPSRRGGETGPVRSPIGVSLGRFRRVRRRSGRPAWRRGR